MKVLRIRDVKLPQRAPGKNAGIDIFIPNSKDFFIKKGDKFIKIENELFLKPGESALIPSGLKISVPENHVAIVFNKSGIAAKRNLVIGACVIDESYQGEIHIDIHNIGNETQIIKSGEKITQLLVLPINYTSIEEVNSEEECFGGIKTERGEGGFGSTGTE